MPRLGEVLIAAGACTRRDIEHALTSQQLFGSRLGTNLLRIGAVRESDLAEALGIIHGVPSLCGDIHPDPGALRLLRKDIVDRYQIVPYSVARGDIALLVRDPRDLRVLDDIAFATGRNADPLVVPEARLWALMWKLYGIDHGVRADRDGITAVAIPARPVARVEPAPRHGGARLS